jgi:SAM-dependent methyltransferase
MISCALAAPGRTSRRCNTVRSVAGNHQSSWACEFGDAKLEAVGALLRRRFGHGLHVLAVGCGDGTEAAVLGELLESTVVGVDVEDEFHPDARGRVELVLADARRLPFPDGSFDLVFSYHALEHIPEPEKAVREMRRVVRPGGGVWVGTPNRSRLLGYLGSRDASTRDKIVWNLAEWRTRLRGRFRNELGAHAGFTRRELSRLLDPEFEVVEDDTSAYYALLYPRHRRLLAAFERLRLARFLYPSIYFAGHPGRTDEAPAGRQADPSL